MLIFLYGPDTYRSQQKLKEIVAHCKKTHKRGLNLKYLDAEENSYQEFKEEFFQPSLFKEKKLIVLKNVFSNQEFKKNFLKRVEEISRASEVVLILEKKKFSEKDNLFQSLKKHGRFQEFDFLAGKELEEWARKKFQNLGVKIEIKTIRKLFELENQDFWRLNNDIEKLANYKMGQFIVENDIELLVGQKIEIDIFRTIESLAKKEKRTALDLIQKHLEKGDNPLYLLSMINFQFRSLLILKSAELVLKYNFSPWTLSKSLGMHPYVIKKAMLLTRKFSLEELKKIYRKLFETDLNIKIGRINPAEGLKMLITEI